MLRVLPSEANNICNPYHGVSAFQRSTSKIKGSYLGEGGGVASQAGIVYTCTIELLQKEFVYISSIIL